MSMRGALCLIMVAKLRMQSGARIEIPASLVATREPQWMASSQIVPHYEAKGVDVHCVVLTRKKSLFVLILAFT